MFKEIDLDTDIEDDGYFNDLVDEDIQFKAACDLVDYLTVDDSNSQMIEMLKMKTGDLTDGKLDGRRFRSSQIERPSKKELLRMASQGEMIVIRPIKEPELISRAVRKNRMGDFYDGNSTWFVVMKYGFRDSLLEEIKSGDLDVNRFYEEENKKSSGLFGLINRIRNK